MSISVWRFCLFFGCCVAFGCDSGAQTLALQIFCFVLALLEKIYAYNEFCSRLVVTSIKFDEFHIHLTVELQKKVHFSTLQYKMY